MNPWAVAVNVALCTFLAISVVLTRRFDPYGIEEWNPDAWSAAVGLPLFVAVTIVLTAMGIHPRGLAPIAGAAAWLFLVMIAVLIIDAPRRPNRMIDIHLIPYSWRRRKPLSMWSAERLTDHIHTVYYRTRGSSTGGISAEAVVVHQDPTLLPRWVTREPGFKPWVAQHFVTWDHEVVGYLHGKRGNRAAGSGGVLARARRNGASGRDRGRALPHPLT
jgi:hypothetical protein